MLELKNVSKFYYNKGMITTGFTKINLEFKMGEFIVITGESGSGKSTLLNVISGLDSYEEGEMYINGKETSHYTEKEFEEYRRRYIANIFQSFNLINSYTVYQNVELVLLLNGYKKQDIKQKVLDIIEKVGLTEFKNTKVSKLSGGQKQRVAIARAIIKDTPVIVADEPTGNLDTNSAREVIEILKNIAKDKLVIVVTHNIEQFEEYATRIIKMHDGRVIENNEIKRIDNDITVEESKYNKITILNKYRLGIRNTFNIVSKFLLLFAVFFFVTAAVLLEYSSFVLSEKDATKNLSGAVFNKFSADRIIIKKKDNTSFSEEDYNKIKSLENIKDIAEDDILVDASLNLRKDDIYLYGNFKNYKALEGKVDIGRLPNAKDEIVIETKKGSQYMENNLDDILNKSFGIMKNYSTSGEVTKVTIVGVKYNEEVPDYNFNFYMTDELAKELRKYVNQIYSDARILFNNKYTEINDQTRYSGYDIIPSEKVEKGKVLVNDELRYGLKNGKIKDMPLKIFVENIYYKEELDLKVSNTFTKTNFKKLTGYDKYEDYRNAIFVNNEEYEAIYNKPSYQSSVYVEDIDIIDDTMKELDNLGIIAKKSMDYTVNYNATEMQIMGLIKVIVTMILVVVLFFVSYFIIRIILKSRNIYYTTLRMLGASFNDVKRILDIELFLNSSLSYIGVVLLTCLSKVNVISFEYLSKLTKYIGIKEYILIYLIMAIMSLLISRRFSRKLFKNTAITTYGEEA